MKPILEIQNVGKKYRIQHLAGGYLSLRERITNAFKFERNETEDFWALKDISFEVQLGEAIGIIGRNGAGKSTLLKILSKITPPTTGRILYRGRIASLLEVGTGFHPELTGRENIFFNGSLLGMKRAEITDKFDEIVDFSGVEKFLDTPLKHYSSGMQLRLAFSVAAFLEPEILIIDEVLAVGDAEFQRKCLGKMEEIQHHDGRTLIFVSHNLPAVKSLCKKSILLDTGTLIFNGETSKALSVYQNQQLVSDGLRSAKNINSSAYFNSWNLANGHSKFTCFSRDKVILRSRLIVNSPIKSAELGLVIRNDLGEIMFSCNSRDFGGDYLAFGRGEYYFDFVFRLPLRDGIYSIDLAIIEGGHLVDQWKSETQLNILTDFKSVLEDPWKGLISEEVTINYEKID